MTADLPSEPSELPMISAAEAEGLQRHILRARAFKRQLRPVQSFLRAVPGDSVIPAELQEAIDVLCSEQQWNTRTANISREKGDALWDVATRCAAEYAVLQRVLGELRRRLPWLRPARVVDVGFATGRTAWAVQETWETAAAGAGQVQEYIAVEADSRLAALGKRLTVGLQLGTVRHLPKLVNRVEGGADIVICSYALQAVGKDKRKALLDLMWRSVRRGGALLLVEQGTDAGFAVIRNARQHVLQQFTQPVPPSASTAAAAAASASAPTHPLLPGLPSPPSVPAFTSPSSPTVIAPCGHDAACPHDTRGGSCTFGQRLLRSSLPVHSPMRAVRGGREQLSGIVLEKLSYVIILKGKVQVRGTWQPTADNREEEERRREFGRGSRGGCDGARGRGGGCSGAAGDGRLSGRRCGGGQQRSDCSSRAARWHSLDD